MGNVGNGVFYPGGEGAQGKIGKKIAESTAFRRGSHGDYAMVSPQFEGKIYPIYSPDIWNTYVKHNESASFDRPVTTTAGSKRDFIARTGEKV